MADAIAWAASLEEARERARRERRLLFVDVFAPT